MASEKGIKKIIVLTHDNEREVIEAAKKVIEGGGIAIVPTDTVYGIVGRADEENVIKKIFSLKKRSLQKVFPVFVGTIGQARKLAYISDKKAQFLEKFWPGRLTAVFHHKEKLPQILTAGQETLGIRIPGNEFLLGLLEQLDFPLVQTSANITEGYPATDISEISGYFRESEEGIDLVVDAGRVEGKQSTLVSYIGNEPVILRTGAVSKEELEKIFESFRQ